MNILLLEPAYKNKYPPLSLMKLSTFHKQRGDTVVFVKGSDESLIGGSFDRIYINSLFNFEWSLTRKAIDFAYSLAKSPKDIYLGGITASTLTDFVHKEAPDINVVSGLLNIPGKLNLPDDDTIDSLSPDYSILEHIEYEYHARHDYIAYATRGCGMKCSFCAVQQLEPTFVNYVCIKDQIQTIRETSGDKHDLLLMDNNVLKSTKFKEIIDDIIELGYGKGARFPSAFPAASRKRYVDFNQGLDANLLTKEKAELLAKIALKPVRIAFDHISQTEKYLQAVRFCFDAGLRKFSNYILYNSDESSGKGQSFVADTPADLYKRLRINVDFCQELQAEQLKTCPNTRDILSIYSFPMRYIPLNDTKRGHIGTYWNKKHLRAIQVFITPTQGKGVCSPSFFNASFGKTLEEFLMFIDMPESLLVRRGIYIENKKHTEEEKRMKMAAVDFSQKIIQEWLDLYKKINKIGRWLDFAENYLYPHDFRFARFYEIKDPLFKEMYLYYLTTDALMKNIPLLPPADKQFVRKTFLEPQKYLATQFDKPVEQPTTQQTLDFE